MSLTQTGWHVTNYNPMLAKLVAPGQHPSSHIPRLPVRLLPTLVPREPAPRSTPEYRDPKASPNLRPRQPLEERPSVSSQQPMRERPSPQNRTEASDLHKTIKCRSPYGLSGWQKLATEAECDQFLQSGLTQEEPECTVKLSSPRSSPPQDFRSLDHEAKPMSSKLSSAKPSQDLDPLHATPSSDPGFQTTLLQDLGYVASQPQQHNTEVFDSEKGSICRSTANACEEPALDNEQWTSSGLHPMIQLIHGARRVRKSTPSSSPRVGDPPATHTENDARATDVPFETPIYERSTRTQGSNGVDQKARNASHAISFFYLAGNGAVKRTNPSSPSTGSPPSGSVGSHDKNCSAQTPEDNGIGKRMTTGSCDDSSSAPTQPCSRLGKATPRSSPSASYRRTHTESSSTLGKASPRSSPFSYRVSHAESSSTLAQAGGGMGKATPRSSPSASYRRTHVDSSSNGKTSPGRSPTPCSSPSTSYRGTHAERSSTLGKVSPRRSPTPRSSPSASYRGTRPESSSTLGKVSPRSSPSCGYRPTRPESSWGTASAVDKTPQSSPSVKFRPVRSECQSFSSIGAVARRTGKASPQSSPTPDCRFTRVEVSSRSVARRPSSGADTNLEVSSQSVTREASSDAVGPVEVALVPGMRVRLKGLAAQASLNGQEGVLFEEDPVDGRWKVRMDDGSGKKLFAVNLEPAGMPTSSDTDGIVEASSQSAAQSASSDPVGTVELSSQLVTQMASSETVGTVEVSSQSVARNASSDAVGTVEVSFQSVPYKASSDTVGTVEVSSQLVTQMTSSETVGTEEVSSQSAARKASADAVGTAAVSSQSVSREASSDTVFSFSDTVGTKLIGSQSVTRKTSSETIGNAPTVEVNSQSITRTTSSDTVETLEVSSQSVARKTFSDSVGTVKVSSQSVTRQASSDTVPTVEVVTDCLASFLYSGIRVKVVGLQRQTDLNGLYATVYDFDEAEGLWKVIMDDGSGKMMKAANLQVESHIEELLCTTKAELQTGDIVSEAQNGQGCFENTNSGGLHVSVEAPDHMKPRGSPVSKGPRASPRSSPFSCRVSHAESSSTLAQAGGGMGRATPQSSPSASYRRTHVDSSSNKASPRSSPFSYRVSHAESSSETSSTLAQAGGGMGRATPQSSPSASYRRTHVDSSSNGKASPRSSPFSYRVSHAESSSTQAEGGGGMDKATPQSSPSASYRRTHVDSSSNGKTSPSFQSCKGGSKSPVRCPSAKSRTFWPSQVSASNVSRSSFPQGVVSSNTEAAFAHNSGWAMMRAIDRVLAENSDCGPGQTPLCRNSSCPGPGYGRVASVGRFLGRTGRSATFQHASRCSGGWASSRRAKVGEAPDQESPVELTSKLVGRLLKEILEDMRNAQLSKAEDGDVNVGSLHSRWGFQSRAEMMQCIESHANASYIY